MESHLSSAEQIFNAAREKADPSERAAFLEGACGADLGLRAKVDALLRADADAGSFFEKARGRLGIASADTLDPAQAARIPHGEQPGARIGRYKLLQPIGEGGFGTVWMAEQREPVRRQVALKIIKLGMDTKEVIARFEVERQALALMDHPNICKVLDAGCTDTGRPYFVMELVRGVPITEFCDTENLSSARRLQLFIAICQAVQHAHQKGVIHRDLKPSNVMVTLHDGTPVPKVIDFGIAKATNRELTEKTFFTEYRQFIGTPEYMSPEQAEMSGLDIDTRSDIYSLGVLLYELLTGLTPFDSRRLRSAALDEIRRIIREEEPLRPSTRLSALDTEEPSADSDREAAAPDSGRRSSLQGIARSRSTEASALLRSLRGDLDWIVMKALEKERGRRYETASALALDIERHLKHEPVLASPPSRAYKLRKFVARNRAGVSAAALLLLALLLGVTGTTYGLLRALDAERRAESERDEARVQAGTAEAINDFLNDDLLAAVAPSAEEGRGRDVLMLEVLDAAAQRIDRAAAPGGHLADQPRVEASVRKTIGLTYSALDQRDAADRHFDRALELFRRELGETHHETLEVRIAIATEHTNQERFDAAEADLEDILEKARRVRGESSYIVIEALLRYGTLRRWQQRYDEAEQLLLEGLETLEAWSRGEPKTHEIYEGLGNVYLAQDRFDEADAALATARRSLERAQGESGPDTLRVRLEQIYVLSERSEGTRGAERKTMFERVARELETLRATMEQVLGENHWNTINCVGALGSAYGELGQLDEAAKLHQTTLERRKASLPAGHWLIVLEESHLAQTRARQGEHAEARELAEGVIRRFAPDAFHKRARTIELLDDTARILKHRGAYADAAAVLGALLDDRFPRDAPGRVDRVERLAGVLRELGRYEESERWYLDAIRSQTEAADPRSFEVLHTTAHLGMLYSDMARHELASEKLEAGLPALIEGVDEHPHCYEHAMKALLACYEHLGRADDSLRIKKRAIDVDIARAERPDAGIQEMNDLAYTLLICEEELRRPAAALALATRACERAEATGDATLWLLLDTLALARLETGDPEGALRTQRKAMGLMPENAPWVQRQELEQNLKRIERAAGLAPPKEGAASESEDGEDL